LYLLIHDKSFADASAIATSETTVVAGVGGQDVAHAARSGAGGVVLGAGYLYCDFADARDFVAADFARAWIVETPESTWTYEFLDRVSSDTVWLFLSGELCSGVLALAAAFGGRCLSKETGINEMGELGNPVALAGV